jgi:hypothetical protein
MKIWFKHLEIQEKHQKFSKYLEETEYRVTLVAASQMKYLYVKLIIKR